MKQIILPILVCVLAAVPAAAQNNPFALEIDYDPQEQYLTIDLERLSRNESEHFMYRLEVYKNEILNMEENLINQNHLNELSRSFKFPAEPEDTITVKLHFGQDQEFEASVTVPGEAEPDEKAKEEAGQPASRLVGSETDIEFEQREETAPFVTEDTEKLRFGYTVEKEKEYGYERKDRGPDADRYGYTLNENESYSRQVIHETDEKPMPYGYKNEGREDIGQDSYGYSEFGYEGDPTPFGRENYN